jgi:hypothetical protein
MILETEMSYEEMQAYIETHRCACGSRLTIAWGGSFGHNCYIVRCGKDPEHDTFTGHDKKEEDYKKLKREVLKLDSKSLTTMPESQMIERINSAKFPQELSPADKILLAKAAISYGFDPLMGEITIFQGRPYISIDGRYRMAQETEKLDGVESRPANEDERSEWRIPNDDYFFHAEVYVKGSQRPFVGWGRVRAEEQQIKKDGDKYKPIVTNPQRMAEKRAEAQALRKAFHIPLPSIEDVPEYEDIDTEYRIVEESTSSECTQSKSSDPEPGNKGNGNPERDLELITSVTELQKACEGDFGMKRADCLKELNISSWPELAITPKEAYQQIAAVRNK